MRTGCSGFPNKAPWAWSQAHADVPNRRHRRLPGRFGARFSGTPIQYLWRVVVTVSVEGQRWRDEVRATAWQAAAALTPKAGMA